MAPLKQTPKAVPCQKSLPGHFVPSLVGLQRMCQLGQGPQVNVQGSKVNEYVSCSMFSLIAMFEGTS